LQVCRKYSSSVLAKNSHYSQLLAFAGIRNVFLHRIWEIDLFTRNMSSQILQARQMCDWCKHSLRRIPLCTDFRKHPFTPTLESRPRPKACRLAHFGLFAGSSMCGCLARSL
jgi:hypothetical protein